MSGWTYEEYLASLLKCDPRIAMSSVGVDLKSQLTAILGEVERLRNYTSSDSDDASRTQSLDSIERTVWGIVNIVAAMIEYDHIQPTNSDNSSE